MPTVEIIGLPQSNFVWATRIALAEKGVEHISTSADPHSPEVLAVHPFGKIPVMRHGDVAIGESRAIIDYIDRVFPGPSLMPVDPVEAAEVSAWTSIVIGTIEPLIIRQYMFAYLFPGTGDGAPDRLRIEAVFPKVEQQLDVLERAMADGRIGGRSFTTVDAYLVPILFYLRTMPEGGPAIAERPMLQAYLDTRSSRDSVTSTMPARSENA